MTKSELIEALAQRQTHLAFGDVEMAVRSVLEQMSGALSEGPRNAVRGLGSFSLH
jgi:integration host factor subunit beta